MGTIARGTKAVGGTAFSADTDALAAEVNTDFDNIYNEFNSNIDDDNIKDAANIDPGKIGDYSADNAEMQTQRDPYSGGTPQLALNLEEELANLRYKINQIMGTTYWYEDAIAFSTGDVKATIKTSGFDIMFNWHADIRALGWDVPGSLGLTMQATVLDTYETRQSPAPYDVPIEWKGSLGPNLPGTQGGAYDYRLFSSLTYMQPNWSVSLRWRHLPTVWTDSYAEQQALIANNARVTAGGDGLMLGYTPTTQIETDSYNIFDLSGTWDINEKVSFRGGITNLFDEEPVDVGSTAGYPAGSDLDVCNDAPGCSNPDNYSLGSRGGWMFMGGYYDTLGRRFFLGVKVRM